MILIISCITSLLVYTSILTPSLTFSTHAMEQQEAKEEGKGIKRKNDEVENVGKGSKADQVNTKMTEPLSKQKNIKTSSSDLKIKEDSEEREEEETYADPQSQDH